jgi:hypothetical protein
VRQAVQVTAELRRIAALPRRGRPWEEIYTDDVCKELTKLLARPGGKMILKPVQVAGLVELHDTGGWFGQAGVGSGKTLITMLAPVILKAERPILFVPSKLLRKTQNEFRLYDEHFNLTPMRFARYEILSRADGAREYFETLQPDCIGLDEGHKCKSTTSACTRKIKFYLRTARAAGRVVHVYVCSGTFAKRSIEDFAHIAEWTHPTSCPLPPGYGERLLWSKAIDEGVPDEQRVDPGALRVFVPADLETENELERVRIGVQRRIFETPGFLATRSNDVPDCSLTIECHEVAVPPEVDKLFEYVKTKWRKPPHHGEDDGDEIESAAVLWATSRALACGLHHYWRKPAPPVWLSRRRAYFKGVRKKLHCSRHLHSPDEVARELERVGDKGDEKHREFWAKYQAWKEVEHEFKPDPGVRLVHDYALKWVEQWAKKNDGLIWVEWPFFGQLIAKRLGIKYYGEGGEASDGSTIEQASKVERLAVASLKANFEGRNLQEGLWSRMLFTSAPTTGSMNEQGIARIHRSGHKADEVVADYMIACLEQANGFFQAMRDAGFHSAVLGSEMKLHRGGKTADIIVPTFKRRGWAWEEPVRDD